MTKTEEIEAKINKTIEILRALQRENLQLKTERDSLQSHVTMLTGENHKAQRLMADYELLRKKHDQVTHKVERALHSLSAMNS